MNGEAGMLPETKNFVVAATGGFCPKPLMGRVLLCFWAMLEEFQRTGREHFCCAAIATGGRLFSDILNYVSSESGARK